MEQPVSESLPQAVAEVRTAQQTVAQSLAAALPEPANPLHYTSNPSLVRLFRMVVVVIILIVLIVVLVVIVLFFVLVVLLLVMIILLLMAQPIGSGILSAPVFRRN